MSFIPDFLMKRVYKQGSLRETAEGIAFDLKNILGPGAIDGISFIQINESTYTADMIKVISQGMETLAENITPKEPMNFRLNQEGTLLLEQAKGLQDGINQIIVELISTEAGKVKISLTDSFAH